MGISNQLNNKHYCLPPILNYDGKMYHKYLLYNHQECMRAHHIEFHYD